MCLHLVRPLSGSLGSRPAKGCVLSERPRGVFGEPAHDHRDCRPSRGDRSPTRDPTRPVETEHRGTLGHCDLRCEPAMGSGGTRRLPVAVTSIVRHDLLMGPRGCLVVVSLVGLLAGCSPNSGTIARPKLSLSASSTPASKGSCVRATGVPIAHDGRVLAGPFTLENLDALDALPDGTKVWVESTSRRDISTAVIEAASLEGPSKLRQVRTPSQRATLDDGTRNFWPGLLRLPGAGRWRVTISIGPDTGCFLIDVPG